MKLINILFHHNPANNNMFNYFILLLCSDNRIRVVVKVLDTVDSFGVMVRVRVRIRVYVKPFCSAENRKYYT